MNIVLPYFATHYIKDFMDKNPIKWGDKAKVQAIENFSKSPIPIMLMFYSLITSIKDLPTTNEFIEYVINSNNDNMINWHS